jgi:hypothetical protein
MLRSRARTSRVCRASRTVRTKSISNGGAPAAAARFHCWLALGTRSRPCRSRGRPHASASAGQATSHSCMSWYDSRQSVRSSAIKSSDSSA